MDLHASENSSISHDFYCQDELCQSLEDLELESLELPHDLYPQIKLETGKDQAYLKHKAYYVDLKEPENKRFWGHKEGKLSSVWHWRAKENPPIQVSSLT